jgi:FkbM family methyltransferase
MDVGLRKAVRRYRLSLRRVLHIGAHHGQEDGLYARLGIAPIYVEANPEVYRVLCETLPQRECHNLAITDHTGTVDFHITSNDYSSSILHLKKHKEIYPDIVEERTIQVKCTTIDELLGPRKHEIDCLVMDIQGAELMALRGGTETLPHVKCIVSEVNRAELYEGCGLMEEVDSFLEGFDFRRVASEFKYDATWGDALYVKSEYAERRGWISNIRALWPLGGRAPHKRLRRSA